MDIALSTQQLMFINIYFHLNRRKLLTLLTIFKKSGQKWAVKFKKQGLNPWYERNLEIIMMNMQNMMKQAQKLQKQMEKSQAELAATTFTGKSAQDLVVAELTGDKKVVNITFADAVVDPDDVETLQDMTVQALNDALGQIDEATKKSMGAFAGKLPF